MNPTTTPDLDSSFGPDGNSMMVPDSEGRMVLRAGHRSEEDWRRLWAERRRAESAAANDRWHRDHRGGWTTAGRYSSR